MFLGFSSSSVKASRSKYFEKKEEKKKLVAVKYFEDGFVLRGFSLVTCALRLTPSVLLNHFQSFALPCLGGLAGLYAYLDVVF